MMVSVGGDSAMLLFLHGITYSIVEVLLLAVSALSPAITRSHVTSTKRTDCLSRTRVSSTFLSRTASNLWMNVIII